MEFNIFKVKDNVFHIYNEIRMSSLKGKSFISKIWMTLKIECQMAKFRCWRKSNLGRLSGTIPKTSSFDYGLNIFSFISNSCPSVCYSEIGKLMLVDKLASKNYATLLKWSISQQKHIGTMALCFIVIKVTYVPGKLYIGALLHNKWRYLNYNR